MFFENSVRGGISTISKRLRIANNPYMLTTLQKKIPILSVTIVRIFMRKRCVHRFLMENFVGFYDDEISYLDIINVDGNSEKGYILEVDIAYPENLRDLHADYPM